MGVTSSITSNNKILFGLI